MYGAGGKDDVLTHTTCSTGGVVHIDPVWTVMCVEVLATVLIETSAPTHSWRGLFRRLGG